MGESGTPVGLGSGIEVQVTKAITNTTLGTPTLKDWLITIGVIIFVILIIVYAIRFIKRRK